jgi:hypothetical protein
VKSIPPKGSQKNVKAILPKKKKEKIHKKCESYST